MRLRAILHSVTFRQHILVEKLLVRLAYVLFELLGKCIYNFSQQITLSSNSIITACLTPVVFIHSLIRQW